MKKYGCVKVKLLLFFITVTAQFLCFCEGTITNSETRSTENFGKNWKFRLGDLKDSERPTFDDSGWRLLNLPHDWSIEGPFSKDAPATPGGGALPGGIGWYRKIFYLPEIQKDKMVFVNFDGIYMNSEVWMNGHYMGKRPNGYISFRYDLTPFLNYGQEKNVIAVRVDNSLQPNSRWYSGSGIYRNVWLVITDRIHIDHWGICVTTPEVNEQAASVNIVTRLRNTSEQDRILTLRTSICNENGKELLSVVSDTLCSREAIIEVKH